MDLLNKRFGRLVVVDTFRKDGNIYCHCKCDCGHEKDVYYGSLLSGATKSCGCYNSEVIHERTFMDLTGKRFGRLTVTEYVGFDKKNNTTKYRCKCDCGNEIIVCRTSLTSGNTQSCGCVVKDRKRERLDAKLNKWYGDLYTLKVVDYNERHPRLESVCKNGHHHIHRDDFYEDNLECIICKNIAKYRNRFLNKECGVYLIDNVVFDGGNYLLMCGDKSFTMNEFKTLNSKKHKHSVKVGDRFGSLEVKDIAVANNKTYCICLCHGCGSEISILKSQIYTRHSCGGEYCTRSHLEGKRFGRWKVLSYNEEYKKWNCECECGNTGLVSTGDLNSGHSMSCGCLSHEYASLNGRKDLVGQRFGRLVVVSREVVGGYKVGDYVCKCDCGKVVNVRSTNLIQGHTSSCGCLLPNIDGSKKELELKKFIESISGKEFKKIKILDGKEIDMYNEELKLGIEYNGSPFHASVNNFYTDKPKNYHRDKFLLAKEKGIHLISIFDVDYEQNKEKIDKYLFDILHPNKVIYARKCSISLVSCDEARVFLESNHLQGFYRMCKVNYGLYYNNKLVAVMSFGKLRMTHTETGHFELHRYAVCSGYTVVGGAEKLFKHFVIDYCPSYIRTYSDNDYFLGSIYERLGFRDAGQSSQRYYWVKSGRMLKREQCRLKYLKVKYPELYQESIDNSASNKETYIMSKLKAQKVYHSGITKWEWQL